MRTRSEDCRRKMEENPDMPWMFDLGRLILEVLKTKRR